MMKILTKDTYLRLKLSILRNYIDYLVISTLLNSFEADVKPWIDIRESTKGIQYRRLV